MGDAMGIYKMDPKNIPIVASKMCTIKPDWWDYEGAFDQLSRTQIETVGWYLGEDEEHPKGWILCRELPSYRTIDLECSGYDDNGEFKAEHKLEPLIREAEEYAKRKGYLTFRSGISSVGFNIHEQEITSIPEAIVNISCDRVDFRWYLDYGFRVIGIHPNAYGNGFHLIMLAKDISY